MKEKPRKKLPINNFFITLSAVLMMIDSYLLGIQWMGHVAGGILVIQVALNIFAFQRELTDEEIEKQARALARLFIKMHLSKHGKEIKEDSEEALRNFLEDEK